MNELDLGLQPLCNRFLEKGKKDKFVNAMHLVQDMHSGLVRIKTPASAEEMQTRHKWLSETEPLNHFKSIAKTIKKLPRLSQKSKIMNFSYRDKPLTKELNKLGFDFFLSIEDDIEDYDPNFIGVAKIQEKLCNHEFINIIKDTHGCFDLVLANRILHHVHDLKMFFLSIDKLLNKNGYAILEVPDCERGFKDLDYNIIFEEHVSYFTKNTLKHVIELNGFEIVAFDVFTYPFEDALVAIIKKLNGQKRSVLQKVVLEEQKLFKKFTQKYPKTKKSIKSFFYHCSTKGPIIFFGAGHHGISFVNIMNISDSVDCFIDDCKDKHKYVLPGSCLPIYGSDHLSNNYIAHCVVSVSQENEGKVIDKIKSISKSRVEIFSIFPASSYALPIYRN